MNILLAPDSFKGSLTSVQVAETMRSAIVQELPTANVTIFPLADGGEGSMEAIYSGQGGEWINLDVQGPLGETRRTKYLRQGPKAFIELAEAAGLTTLEEFSRDPGRTSTFGTGQQIRHAQEHGADHIFLCIGGSATNDAGLGIAAAMGYKFKKKDGSAFIPTGDNLQLIHTIDSSAVLRPAHFTILCDVKNPFIGTEGAVYTYGRQKGAKDTDLDRLESNMVVFADQLVDKHFPRVHDLPGAGAAGGVGGGLYALFDAKLSSGIDFILDLGLREALRKADLVITGEGILDSQTFHGKAVAGIAEAATKAQVPVLAICGAVDLESEEVASLGLAAAWSIQKRCQSLEEAFNNSKADLNFVTRQLMRSMQIL